jgi:hypothetical protein
MNVSVFTPEQIAAFLKITISEVCLGIASERFHLANSLEEIKLVCGNSLKGGNKKFSEGD